MTSAVSSDAEVVIAARARIGEGPVIDNRTGRLCWVDIAAGVLHQDDLDTGDQVRWSVGTSLGAVAPRVTQPGFAAACGEGFGYLVSGAMTIADPVLPEASRRMNDAKCDSRGRLWAGSLDVRFRPGLGVLHRWDGDGPSRVVLEGLTLPNGIGWSPADDVMYLVDSVRRVVLTAAFSADDGEVGDFSVLFSVDRGLPDGLSVDLEGCLWIALWGAGEVRRYDPSGRVLDRIHFPVDKPSSCAFGGDGVLYVTTAADGLTDDQLRSQPHAGSVFAVDTRTRGVAVSPFAL